MIKGHIEQWKKKFKRSFEEESQFGYSKDFIQSLFERVSGSYDTLNDWMSLGQHHRWKAEFLEQIPWRPTDSRSLVAGDVACGTCDLFFHLSRWVNSRAAPLKVTTYCIDPNLEMLEKGLEKIRRWEEEGNSSLGSWIPLLSYGEDLWLDSCTLDVYTIAFGLRNVSSLERTLSEAYRVLKPGGWMGIMEFSQPKRGLLDLVYRPYLDFFIPLLGEKLARDREAYEYLSHTILQFPNPDQLMERLVGHGFSPGFYHQWTGGIVASHWVQKPTRP